jgi:hypothetical protein
MLLPFLRRLLWAWLPLSLGCAMCAGPDDYTYAAYGGRWQRDNMVTGRVGSIFDPAGGPVFGEAVLPAGAMLSSEGTEGDVPREAGEPEAAAGEMSDENAVEVTEERESGSEEIEPEAEAETTADAAEETADATERAPEMYEEAILNPPAPLLHSSPRTLHRR